MGYQMVRSTLGLNKGDIRSLGYTVVHIGLYRATYRRV